MDTKDKQFNQSMLSYLFMHFKQMVKEGKFVDSRDYYRDDKRWEAFNEGIQYGYYKASTDAQNLLNDCVK